MATTAAALPPTDAAAETPAPVPAATAGAVQRPRVVIQFCTQCKWMLRAAYELLSTFGTALGEVALQPATGGVFRVTIDGGAAAATTTTILLWDRKTHGGFPETKELKRRVRDVVAPGRDLGHVDRATATATATGAPAPASTPTPTNPPKDVSGTDKQAGSAAVCEDCQ